MVKEDIFANKLLTLTTRKRPVNRDIYDTWFLLNEHWDINWDLIEKRSLLTKEEFVKRCIDILENWPLSHTLDGLGELMDESTKDWVKKNLIKDTIFLLKARYGFER